MTNETVAWVKMNRAPDIRSFSIDFSLPLSDGAEDSAAAAARLIVIAAIIEAEKMKLAPSK